MSYLITGPDLILALYDLSVPMSVNGIMEQLSGSDWEQ